MEPDTQPPPPSPFLDKSDVQRMVAEQNARMGFLPDLAATAETAQAMTAARLRALGLRAEDNIFSCGIVAARDTE